ncbi:MAG TPA: alpha/beta hydrolase [Polyangia bacterium]|jgi:acetyl esterase/lipase|nr:alpha/beta hydrolase [Polyangia bacterium]
MRTLRAALAVLALGAALSGPPAHAEIRPAGPLDTAVLIATHYRVEPNQLYLSVGGWNGRLDLYLPRRPRDPMPVALLFHGGGWQSGSKDEIALDVLPYLAMGFVVANVDYRLARVATAPAAVEDSRCALRWVIRHAKQYGLDTDRVILVGSSAGAHLALMAALAPASAGFDGLCPGDEPLKVAAVINFFGVVDVGELLGPANPRDFAVGWIGNPPDRAALARRVSPITYVHKGAPPIFTAHGDADPVVPFAQAHRLHEALDRAGVPNRLFPLRNGGHGEFDGADVLRVNRAVRDFLLKHGVIKKGQSELLQ